MLLTIYFAKLSTKYCYCLFLDDTTAEVENEEEFDQDVSEDDKLGKPTYEDQKRKAESFP